MVENKLGSKIEGEEYLVLHEFAKKAKAKLSAPPDTATIKLVSILNDLSNFLKILFTFWFKSFDL